MSTKHDLIFFEKRSTPKVITSGMKFDAPESYGKQTKRRPATEAEEKQIANGQWVRVDEKGTKGGQPGYKKTKMAGREHLVSHEDQADVFLAHFGVKGMKWGVIRSRDSIASGAGKARDSVVNAKNEIAKVPPEIKRRRLAILERDFKLFDRNVKKLDAEHAELQKLPKGFTKNYKVNVNRQNRELNRVERDRREKDIAAVKSGKLTSTQKKILIGAGIVAALGIAVALNQANESGALNSSILRGKAFVTGATSPFRINKDLSGKMSAADILSKVSAPINPKYKTQGGSMNCRRTTFAYELRRRGYDVVATTAAAGTGQSESGFINAVTPGAKNFINPLSASLSIQRSEELTARGMSTSLGALRDKRSNPIAKEVLRGLNLSEKVSNGMGGKTWSDGSSSLKVLQALEKQPEGARGEVLFNFSTFGHSMAYEIIGGKAHIFDNQKAKLYDSVKRVESKWDGFHSAEITRLDNVDLDIGFLTRWATNTPAPTGA